MTTSLEQAYCDVSDWFARARAAGWLTEAEAAALDRFERAAPKDLFDEDQSRPLVVAFFGGTGVGKSSLLNRLAGGELARTGVERPTSNEVTLFVHESVALQRLGDQVPLDRVQVKRHSDNARRDVLWIDMPDIDSTASENRELALAWLAYIDLVVYVVSPERYRDDAGWRVLRQRGARHGWMFAMNHWDAGCEEQIHDFRRLLREAGFAAPIVLRTCCSSDGKTRVADEFERLEQAVRELIEAHGLRELERLGRRARLRDLRRVIVDAAKRLGDDDGWRAVARVAEERWDHVRGILLDGMEWTLAALAARFASHPESVLKRVMSQAAKKTASAGRLRPESDGTDDAEESTPTDRLTEVAAEVWDAWADSKISEYLHQIEVAARRAGVAAEPVCAALERRAGRAGELVTDAIETSLRLGMARPGSALQRAARHVTGFCMTLLPILALVWIADSVVRGYWRGATGQGEFLGMPFAVHSALLVLVAWGVPYAFDRLLRPRLERTALRSMRAGLADGLERLRAELDAALNEADRQRRELAQQAQEIAGRIAAGALRRVDALDEIVSRVIAAAGA